MDAVWLGFLSSLFGGLIALAGTYLANHFALRKSREEWDRQRQAEREKLEREEATRATEHLREIYANCLRSLTQYINVPHEYDPYEDEGALSPEEKERRREADIRRTQEQERHYVEAQHWLWLLSINLTDIGKDETEKFNEQLNQFVAREWVEEEELREQVFSLALNDPRLRRNSTTIALSLLDSEVNKRSLKS